jgi:hypothetical protein
MRLGNVCQLFSAALADYAQVSQDRFTSLLAELRKVALGLVCAGLHGDLACGDGVFYAELVGHTNPVSFTTSRGLTCNPLPNMVLNM